MQEIWKNIENTNYSISNLGNLKFLGFKIFYGSGKIIEEPPVDIIPLVDRSGYKVYFIKDFNNKSIYHKSACIPIHRLVAEAFLIKIPDKNCVNHIDGNKLNNNVNNLEWTTIGENVTHAHKAGLISKRGCGFKNPKTILKKDQVDVINNLIEKGSSYKEIEELLGFTQGYLQTKNLNSKRRVKGTKIKQDLTTSRFKNANKDFVGIINKYIQEGYKDKEIEIFVNVPPHYICEMRRMKKFKDFVILPANVHSTTFENKKRY